MSDLLSLRLGALGERSTRLAWLGNWLAHAEVSLACAELEALLEAAETRSPNAALGVISVAQWLVGAVNPLLMHELAIFAEHAEGTAPRLARMLAQAQNCPLEFHAGNAAPPKRGTDRPLSLGERKNLARRSDRKALAQLLRDPHPAVLEQLFFNPLLTEPDLVRLVTLRPPSVSGICSLARDGRWLLAPRVRTGLLHNSDLPPWQTLPLLWLCTHPELTRVAQASSLPDPLRAAAEAQLAYDGTFTLPPPSSVD